MRRLITITVAIAILIGLGFAVRYGWSAWQRHEWEQVAVTGGPLLPAQAAYDVRRYDLAVAVHPKNQTIDGRNKITVAVLKPLKVFEVQLDGHLSVYKVSVDGQPAAFSHSDGMIRVPLTQPWQTGSRHAVTVSYGGAPYVAVNPPWMDGFVWAHTPSGAPWIGVTSEGSGGDIWWPCKDAPSDEPDEGMTIALTVPDSLVGLSNGRKLGETHNANGTITTHWRVSYPINNYDVTINVAPYVPIKAAYHGIHGNLDKTIIFWALPQDVKKARKMWLREGAKILTVLGRRFGEYPFLRDKYWVAEAPYEGMEHQTLIAYGSHFKDNKFGFDFLLLHETAHEWWGNKLTARDWSDFWLHEGFAAYSEAIYVNDTLGVTKYLEYMHRDCSHVKNKKPIVQGKNLTGDQAYIGDIYTKGACVLHTLRWMLGDKLFFKALYQFQNDPRFAYKLVSTKDFTDLVNHMAGKDLDWFWQRYLYKAAEPEYTLTRKAGDQTDTITLRWRHPDFKLPLPVAVDGKTRRIAMPNGGASFTVPHGAKVVVDPKGWVLAKAA
ncbi:MAG TPA: M1 family metallopeptidase [Gammaproteobacteria bacterium]|nr:M1 family metallopeptidase [Gammaproteobacteria bacterium]